MPNFKSSEMRKFDQVNRMSIPPQFRTELGSPVVIVKSIHEDPCLFIYSEKEYDRFSKSIIRKCKGRAQAVAQRQLASRIDIAVVDKSGRISLGDDFKEFAQLEEDVFVIGMGNRIELWNKEIWDEYNMANPFDFSDISLCDPEEEDEEE